MRKFYQADPAVAGDQFGVGSAQAPTSRARPDHLSAIGSATAEGPTLQESTATTATPPANAWLFHSRFLHTLYFIPIYFGTLLLFAAGGFELCVLGLLAGALPASERTEHMFQRLIQRHLAFFHWWCDLTRLVHVRYRGFEQCPGGGRVLVANHPAMIDITCLLARLPGAICIFKPAIRRNPVLGAAARRAGYLASDGGHELVRRAAEKTAAGHTLVIFPEGTRTPPGGDPLPFKSGFALIARRAGVPIQLVRITTDSDLLAKGVAWWRLPRLPARVEVTAGPLIPTDTGASTAEMVREIEAWFRAPTPGAVFRPARAQHQP